MRRRLAALAAALALPPARRPPAPQPDGAATCWASPIASAESGPTRKEEFGRERDRPRLPFCRTGAPAAAPPTARSSIPACWSAPIARCNCPAIVNVWNLENGLELQVRVNDRGPAQPGRVIGLSPRAATLLGDSRRRRRPGAARGGGCAEPRAGPRPADQRACGAQLAAAPRGVGARPSPRSPGARQAARRARRRRGPGRRHGAPMPRPRRRPTRCRSG